MEKQPVVIFGVNAVGKIAKEIFDHHGVVTYCFLDDAVDIHHTEVGDVSVLGSTDDDDLLSIVGKECGAFIAVDENTIRKTIAENLKETRKTVPVNAIHPRANLAESAHFEYGNFIDAGATLNSFAKIGNNNVIRANALIDAEAKLGDFVQVGAGSIVNTGVVIENDVFIGSGVIIVGGVKIGQGARVGAGSVVIADVKAGSTVFGNPAAEV